MKTKFYSFIGLILVLAIWSFVSYAKLIHPLLFPSPTDTFISLIGYLGSGTFLIDLWSTLFRTVTGFIIAAFIGVVLGLIMGSVRIVYQSLEFLVDFIRSIPVSAILPVFIVFFGITDISKIAMIVWGASLIVAVNTMYGVRNCNQTRLKVAKTLGASRIQTFIKFIIPDALHHIYAGFRVAVSISLIVVIVAEMFTGTKAGIGMRIYNNSLLFRTDNMFACVIIAGMLGYFLNKLFIFMEGKLLHWSGK